MGVLQLAFGQELGVARYVGEDEVAFHMVAKVLGCSDKGHGRSLIYVLVGTVRLGPALMAAAARRQCRLYRPV